MNRTSNAATLVAALGMLTAPIWSRAQTPPPDAPAAAPDPHTRFAGTFRYIGGDRERSALDAAIDHTVADMSFITRGIARGRLHDKNPVFSAVSFQCAPGSIQVTFSNPSLVYHSRDDGTNVSAQGVGGDSITLSQHFDHGNLIETLTGDSGARHNLFMLSNDGNGLTLRTTITSPRLPTSLRYDLSFHR